MSMLVLSSELLFRFDIGVGLEDIPAGREFDFDPVKRVGNQAFQERQGDHVSGNARRAAPVRAGGIRACPIRGDGIDLGRDAGGRRAPGRGGELIGDLFVHALLLQALGNFAGTHVFSKTVQFSSRLASAQSLDRLSSVQAVERGSRVSATNNVTAGGTSPAARSANTLSSASAASIFMFSMVEIPRERVNARPFPISAWVARSLPIRRAKTVVASASSISARLATIARARGQSPTAPNWLET